MDPSRNIPMSTYTDSDFQNDLPVSDIDDIDCVSETTLVEDDTEDPDHHQPPSAPSSPRPHGQSGGNEATSNEIGPLLEDPLSSSSSDEDTTRRARHRAGGRIYEEARGFPGSWSPGLRPRAESRNLSVRLSNYGTRIYGILPFLFLVVILIANFPSFMCIVGDLLMMANTLLLAKEAEANDATSLPGAWSPCPCKCPKGSPHHRNRQRSTSKNRDLGEQSVPRDEFLRMVEAWNNMIIEDARNRLRAADEDEGEEEEQENVNWLA
jgi:hypothetical protein